VSLGQVITGGVSTTTVTLNVQVEVLAEASVAVHVTVVVPTVNELPEAGEHAMELPGQLSLEEAE
jgi:hypothetical protein